ncbi:hypothetical protein NFJ02_11g05770 [Pycnococcus provasolii]
MDVHALRAALDATAARTKQRPLQLSEEELEDAHGIAKRVLARETQPLIIRAHDGTPVAVHELQAEAEDLPSTATTKLATGVAGSEMKSRRHLPTEHAPRRRDDENSSSNNNGGDDDDDDDDTVHRDQLPESIALLEKSESEKQRGNALYQEGSFDMARVCYERALTILDTPPLVCTPSANRASVPLRTNLASTLLNLGEDALALRQCDLALHTDATCVKALYRRSLVYQRRGLYRAAMSDLDKALALLGDGGKGSADIKAALDACEDALLEQNDAGPDAMEELRAEASAKAAKQGGKGDYAAASDDADAGNSAGESSTSHFATKAARKFLEQVVADARHEYSSKGHCDARVMLRHPHSHDGALSASEGDDGTTESTTPTHGVGRINIEHAFSTAQSLDECLCFVRGQHVLTSADAVAFVVRKRDVLYPKVWWASADWPFAVGEGTEDDNGTVDEADAAVDGVFVEVEERDTGRRASVFLLADHATKELGEPIALSEDCSLLAGESRILV